MIIEFVGPPGSGKTTIAEILKKDNDEVRTEIFPYFRYVRYFPFFALNSIRVIPDIFRILNCRKPKQSLSKRDVALMTVLTGWDAPLKKMSLSKKKTVILEEGAICVLAKLDGFGSDLIRDQCTADWWQKTYRKWAHTLNVVVIFDTPIPVLLERIRSRGLQYELEEMSDEEGCRHLEHIRDAQERVIRKLMDVPDGPVVVHCNTRDKNPAQIAEEIWSLIGSRSFGNRSGTGNKSRHGDLIQGMRK